MLGSPNIPPAPSTPVPGDSDVLLPPTSPDQPSIPIVPRIRQSQPKVRIITPISNFEHPLASNSGYLSPPTHSPSRSLSRPNVPTPTALDLPTRVDVQAMHAIARAEHSGLRGGWVMNLDAGGRAPGKSIDNEMVDIDLEGGKGEVFGSPRISVEEAVEAERSPRLISTRSPSPAEWTPRAASRDEASPIPPSVLAATTALRRPSPITNHTDTLPRINMAEEERDREVIRSRPGQTRRDSSVRSMDSYDGPLEIQDASRRNSSWSVPTETAVEHAVRPTVRLVGSSVKATKRGGSLEGMEEVNLTGKGGGGKGSGVAGVTVGQI